VIISIFPSTHHDSIDFPHKRIVIILFFLPNIIDSYLFDDFLDKSSESMYLRIDEVPNINESRTV